MRLPLFFAATMILAASGTWAAAQQAPPGAPPAEPIVTATRQNAFTIPFRIDPPASPAEKPVEVLLNVSTDRGATWSISSRVRPDKGSFVFRAPHDGEYWFSIRTVDGKGIARPAGPIQPQLKVTVDTVAPRLDLSVVRGPAGEIVARWQAVDPNLKQGGFKLEYQVSSSGPWEKVAVEAPPSAMRHTLSGEATWWPSSASGPILVRAEITDRAGNPAVTQAVVKASPSSPPGTAPPVATTPQPRPASDAGWSPSSEAANAPSSDVRWPPDRTEIDPLASSGTAPERTAPANLPHDPYSGSAPAGFAPDVGTPAQPSRTAARPVSRSQSQPIDGLDFSVLPAAVRPRMVNSPAFELEYEIESVGPSGIGKVELWGTRDGGRTWSDYAVDTDKRSPMPVAVDGEGIYGFRILVQSGTGFGGRPPATGDLPDIWIGVDLTKPTCKITGTEVSPDGSELAVSWEAADAALDPRPVTLLFSENTGGPWTPLASGLENSGSYRWRLDQRVPARVVLRLEVRDEAGNVSTHVLDEPVTLDRNRPQGKIRGVRAINSG